MAKRNLSVYKETSDMIKVRKADCQLQGGESLPSLCVFGDCVGIATEHIKDEEVYIVNISNRKIFSSTLFEETELPTKTGKLIYVKNDGKLTGKKDGATLVGIYLGMEGGAVLFKLN